MNNASRKSPDDEVAAVRKICEGILALCKDHDMVSTYGALTYCLGRCISAAHDPAQLLCLTIPKLASAAKIDCVQLSADHDEEDTGEQDDSQLTIN